MDEELQLYCYVPPPTDNDYQHRLDLVQDLDAPRRSKILAADSLWINGTTLTYFLQQEGAGAGSDRQCKQTRKAFTAWNDLGLGVTFVESKKKPKKTTDAILLRVGFERRGGSWALHGRREILQQPKSQSHFHMNIAWDNSQTYQTALHAIGHILGLPNEHQVHQDQLKWNKARVYEFLQGPPNQWDRATIDHNMFRGVPPTDEIQAHNWDPDSIMQYPLNRGLLSKPTKYQTTPLIPNGGLSDMDQERALLLYPPKVKTRRLVLHDDDKSNLELQLDDGGQARFNIRVDQTVRVELFVSGEADTYLVLFQRKLLDDHQLLQLAADDDTGRMHENARIHYTLQAELDYVVQVRLVWMERGMIEQAPRIHLEEATESDGGDEHDPYNNQKIFAEEQSRASYKRKKNKDKTGETPQHQDYVTEQRSENSGYTSGVFTMNHDKKKKSSSQQQHESHHYVTQQRTENSGYTSATFEVDDDKNKSSSQKDKDNHRGSERQSTKGLVPYRGTDKDGHDDDDDHDSGYNPPDPPKSCCVVL